MDLKNIPFTNGINQNIKGHVDLTELLKEVIEQSNREIQELKDQGKW